MWDNQLNSEDAIKCEVKKKTEDKQRNWKLSLRNLIFYGWIHASSKNQFYYILIGRIRFLLSINRMMMYTLTVKCLSGLEFVRKKFQFSISCSMMLLHFQLRSDQFRLHHKIRWIIASWLLSDFKMPWLISVFIPLSHK